MLVVATVVAGGGVGAWAYLEERDARRADVQRVEERLAARDLVDAAPADARVVGLRGSARDQQHCDSHAPHVASTVAAHSMVARQRSDAGSSAHFTSLS